MLIFVFIVAAYSINDEIEKLKAKALAAKLALEK